MAERVLDTRRIRNVSEQPVSQYMAAEEEAADARPASPEVRVLTNSACESESAQLPFEAAAPSDRARQSHVRARKAICACARCRAVEDVLAASKTLARVCLPSASRLLRAEINLDQRSHSALPSDHTQTTPLGVSAPSLYGHYTKDQA
jgi:hypothetical protein